MYRCTVSLAGLFTPGWNDGSYLFIVLWEPFFWGCVRVYIFSSVFTGIMLMVRQLSIFFLVSGRVTQDFQGDEAIYSIYGATMQ